MPAIGQRVRINSDSGFHEFRGKTGTIISGPELDGQMRLWRIELDEPVHVEGVGVVEDDLWSSKFFKRVR